MQRAKWWGLPALVAMAMGVAACASGSSSPGAGGESADPFDGGNTREVSVIVDNRNTSDATLYMIWGSGNRVRLGRISGLSEGEFTTRWYGPDVRMEARFLAGERYVTNSLPVSPGEILELHLPGNLD